MLAFVMLDLNPESVMDADHQKIRQVHEEKVRKENKPLIRACIAAFENTKVAQQEPSPADHMTIHRGGGLMPHARILHENNAPSLPTCSQIEIRLFEIDAVRTIQWADLFPGLRSNEI